MEMLATVDVSVIVWDVVSGETIATLYGSREATLWCLNFSPCGSLLAAGTFEGPIFIWDCDSWTKRSELMGHTDMINSVCFDGAGERILSVSSDRSVRLWNLTTVLTEFRIDFPRSSVIYYGNFNSSGNEFAISVDSNIDCYDSFSGVLTKQLPAHHRCHLRCVKFSRDGNFLAAGSEDGIILLWDVPSGILLRELHGHKYMNTVSEVCFNADASRIVSCAWDGTTRVWDVSTGECLLVLRCDEEEISSCCFSEDGSKVLATDKDATVNVWDSYTGEELRTLNCGTIAVSSISYRPSKAGSFI